MSNSGQGTDDWTMPSAPSAARNMSGGMDDWTTPATPQATWGSDLRDLATGFGKGLTDTASMAASISNPLDLAARGANLASGMLGGHDIIPSQFIPSSGISHLGSTAMNAAGLTPDVPAPTAEGRLFRNIGLGASAVAIPGGEGGILANAGRNLLTGVASGIGTDVGEEIAPDQYKPLAGLVGGALAGTGASTASLIPGAISRAFTPSPNAVSNLADFRAEGIPPLATPILDNKSIGSVEATLAKAPGAGPIYERAQNATRDALENRVNTVANQFGPVSTPQQASTVIQKGAQEAADRYTTRGGKLYDAALQPVLGVKPRSLSNLENLSQKWTAELDSAPESLGPTTGAMLNRVNAVLRDVSTGNATINSLRQIRTGIGRDLGDPVLAGISSAQQPYLKQMYGALSDDINSAAIAADPTIAKKLAVADRYWRTNQKVFDTVRDVVGNDRQNGEIFQSLLSSGQGASGGGQTIATMRKALTPAQWDVVAGTTLGRLGLANPGAQEASSVAGAADTFSPASFLTNWSKLSPEAKQAMFGGTRYQALRPSLDRLVRIAGGVKAMNAAQAGSPTFERGARWALLGAIGESAASNLMSGNVVRAVADPAAYFIAGYAAPRMAARLMTDPKFIGWLANRASASTPVAISRSTAALRALSGTSPAIADYLSTLQQSPSQSQEAP